MGISKITTYDEALAAVKKDGRALEYVPENLKTEETPNVKRRMRSR